jgi:hypothetical protein
MILARNVYVPVMCLAGVATGAFLRANPAFGESLIPPYAWLLGVSLILDIAFAAAAARFSIVPLTMNTRVAGFLSGVALYLLIVYAFPMEGVAKA